MVFLRIVSGILKSRQLNTNVSDKTRPTTDKVRSALFSILSNTFEFENVLDGFAGTGALGIEAYSRGAKHIDFIEKDISCLKTNVKLMDNNSYKIYKGDFFKTAAVLNKQYDLIMFDPPYNMYETNKILDTVYENNLLKKEGIIMYEEFYKTEFKLNNTFIITDERKYGDTVIRLLKYNL